MSITEQQIHKAQENQHTAAHDECPQIRLIAGPGSGKSFAIQERVHWLLSRNVAPDSIFVISFTRASTRDIKNRIIRYCKERGFDDVDQVNVSTLHSLALRSLRAAGLLNYPADPLVMDDWELDNILDQEFSRSSNYRPGRCKLIRSNYEAFCGTGEWLPPNYIPPNPPISEIERSTYRIFHFPRTQLYSCVLPGEIVRQCVEQMDAELFDPAYLLGIEHLIIDEYQDLNPTDLEFVNNIIISGVETFVAGDDDQSIYSFRFASPLGIQSFINKYPEASDHELKDCFRCTPEVLKTAQSIMNSFSAQTRLPKNLVSLYKESNPPVRGVVHRWRFPSFFSEVRAIAESCSALIAHGIPASEIMILLSNKRALLQTIKQELTKANVDFEAPRSDNLLDTQPGRFIIAILRITTSSEDYLAHRMLLGIRPGVGPTTCNSIAQLVIENNLNYRDIFYQPLPSSVFTGRELTALNHARDICNLILDWHPNDSLAEHAGDISEFVNNIFGKATMQNWQDFIQNIPEGITIEELRDYFSADTDEQQAALLETIYTRLNIPLPEEGLLPPKVRIMTMHGAKGLSAEVVFIPGLMEDILPGNLRRPYPGLILEAARMLYVSITRARAACIVSYSDTRIVYGRYSHQTRSRFAAHLAGAFERRENGLINSEINQILNTCQQL